MAVTQEQLGEPVDLRAHFAPQRERLVAFLRDIPAVEWARPTACAGWTVADLTAHVLGDVVGRVSSRRDHATGPGPAPGETLERFIDRINEEWVVACRRLSPRIVIDALVELGPAQDRTWTGAPEAPRDLEEPSLGVSWAGISPAPLWLDAGRELTEYWIHEQQLREALGDSGEPIPDVATVLDVFARGLPHTLAARGVPDGTVTLRLADADAGWTLTGVEGRWWLTAADDRGADIVAGADDLWRRWTRQRGAAPAPEGSDQAHRAVLDHVAIVHSDPDADRATD